MKTYKIMFVYNDTSEKIDETDNLTEAKYLLSEYKLAYRNVKNCYVYLDIELPF
ncbi:MAG: hypothetical protein ACXAAH_09535 [Promethearchaeota archaeon]|jgi:hypothetical protein